MKATKLLLTYLPFRSSPILKKSSSSSYLSSAHHETQFPPQVPTFHAKRQAIDFATALSIASSTNNLLLGSATHAEIVKVGFSNDMFTNNNLICMYSKCHFLNGALNLFCEMPQKTQVSWTSMISSCIHSDEHEMGLAIYLEMTRCSFRPNEFTLASMLTACAAFGDIKLGNSFHGVAFKMSYERNSFVGTALLCMYARCGNIEAAELVFYCIDYLDAACWNAMAESFAFSGHGHDAMKIVSLMHLKGISSDEFTFISALKACTMTENVNFGRQIHCFIIFQHLESITSVMNSLMDMYFSNEMTDFAVQVFNRIHNKDIISWNTVICGFAKEEDEMMVADLFYKMLCSGLKPNQVTLSSTFRLCGIRKNLHLGLQFICLAYHLGFFNHPLVVNALINMLSKCGLMAETYFIFSSYKNRSIITYNEMIAGCNMNGHYTEALCMFFSLTKSGFSSDEFTYTSVLNACHGTQQLKISEQIHAKIIKSGFNSCYYICTSLICMYERFGSLGSSYKIFHGIRNRDLASWGAMISAFARRGFHNEACLLLNSLRKGSENPDEFILSSMLNSCSCNGELNQCKSVYSFGLKMGYDMHLHVASAAIDAYSKCGDISSSFMAFTSVSEVDDDAVLYNTMITAFAHHGMIDEAVQILESMRKMNVVPTQSTFVAVISACRHLGLVEKGQYIFDSITSMYGMLPSEDNYGCLVDLLARNGRLEEAKYLIESMPYEPWPAVWRSLLSGCRSYGERRIAMEAAEKLKLQKGSDGSLVLVSNGFAEDGRWEAAANMRMRIARYGIHNSPGYSVVGL